MDVLEKLTDDELRRRREELAAKAVSAPSDEQKAALESLEDIEAVAEARGIKPREEHYTGAPASRTSKGMNLRARIEEGIRRLGSFEQAVAEIRSVDSSADTARYLEFFEDEAKAFKREFRARARATAMDMLRGSVSAINEIVQSYGLPWGSTKYAAENLARGGDLAKEVDAVVRVAANTKYVNHPVYARKRVELAESTRRLKQLQQSVAAKAAVSDKYFEDYRRAKNKDAFEQSHGAEARAADKELAAARTTLTTAWAEAESIHPVLTSLRRGGDIEKVSLDKFVTVSADERMAAVLTELLPKLRDSWRAANKIANKEVDPLTLPAVVSLTRATMFIPKGSMRDGFINDAVTAAKDDADSTLMQIAAFALAVITFIPSAGASLAIPAGIAAVGFAAHTAVGEWEKYSNQKILSNTHLDIARSLSTEEPSLTGFAISLVAMGLEVVPLAVAFNKARKLKRLVLQGAESSAEARALVQELNAVGKARNELPLGTSALNDILTGAKTIPYASRAEVKKGLGAALRGLRHGTAVPNPDMTWVQGILRRSAPSTAANARLREVIGPYYATIRSPDRAAEFAAHVWEYARTRKPPIYPSEALIEIVGGGAAPTRVTGGLTRDHLLTDAPFLDLGFLPGDPHGRYTHMFMEGMISHFHGPGAGRELRHLIANATGPPDLKRRGKEFWETVWDAFFDDETANHINRPEMLGPLLQRHLGLPL